MILFTALFGVGLESAAQKTAAKVDSLHPYDHIYLQLEEKFCALMKKARKNIATADKFETMFYKTGKKELMDSVFKYRVRANVNNDSLVVKLKELEEIGEKIIELDKNHIK